jgi:hypothetical protein
LIGAAQLGVVASEAAEIGDAAGAVAVGGGEGGGEGGVAEGGVPEMLTLCAGGYLRREIEEREAPAVDLAVQAA